LASFADAFGSRSALFASTTFAHTVPSGKILFKLSDFKGFLEPLLEPLLERLLDPLLI